MQVVEVVERNISQVDNGVSCRSQGDYAGGRVTRDADQAVADQSGQSSARDFHSGAVQHDVLNAGEDGAGAFSSVGGVTIIVQIAGANDVAIARDNDRIVPAAGIDDVACTNCTRCKDDRVVASAAGD